LIAIVPSHLLFGDVRAMALASALSVWIHASPASPTAGFTNNRGFTFRTQ
jgi:hypothetical protein